MGRTVTPKYAVYYTLAGPYGWTPTGWNGKQEGRPTDANLAKHVRGYEASTLPGGVNAHLGPTTILAAEIRRNIAGGDGRGPLSPAG